jgi:hypothetical protein
MLVKYRFVKAKSISGSQHDQIHWTRFHTFAPSTYESTHHYEPCRMGVCRVGGLSGIGHDDSVRHRSRLQAQSILSLLRCLLEHLNSTHLEL